MSFAKRLLQARKKAGYTQSELADQSGVSQKTITDIERGRNQSSLYLVQLARALKIDATWLATGEESELRISAQEPLARYTAKISDKNKKPLADAIGGNWIEIPNIYQWAKTKKIKIGPANGESADLGLCYSASFCAAKGWHPSTHFCLRIRGNAMIERGLADGWWVVIDSRVNKIVAQNRERENVYLLMLSGKPSLKMLLPMPGGGLNIVSANSNDSMWKNQIALSPEQAAQLKIIGLVDFVQGDV